MTNVERDVQQQAQGLIEWAASLGVIVTITQVPREPLRMGNHRTVVAVRPVIDHVLEAARRGGYKVGPKCAHCGQRAGGQPCDWIECAALTPADHPSILAGAE
jgi:predicted GNAT family acetyltransferase